MVPADRATPGDVTVVVLAGGTSRRFGSDKLAAPFGDSTLLEEVVCSLPPAWPVVVVGPKRPLSREVGWAREQPPGGGPLAAVAAGLGLVTTPLVVVLAGDMPRAGSAVVRVTATLRTAPPDVGAVVSTDVAGVPNPLLAAYRVAEVVAVLPTPVAGRPARRLLEIAHLEVAFLAGELDDVDTPADLDDLA